MFSSARSTVKHPLSRVFGLITGYLVCFWFMRLAFLTVVAYIVVRTADSSQNALQKIGDMARANQSLVTGFSALLFVVFLQILQPLTRTSFKQVFNFKELKRVFAPNALSGLILTAVMIAGTMLGGHMSYLGIYMRFDEVALAFVSATIFGGSLFAQMIVEEYMFRDALEPRLSDSMGALAAVAVSSLLYLAVKYVQYDLSWIQAGNLVLLNFTFSMIARSEKTYMASAAFASTFMILSHLFFGLPLMGQDMPGILLLRASSDDGLGSLLSGGDQGPEAGLVLTVLLFIYLYLPQIRSKKVEV